jgi:SAM-dependent methyltransferase
MSDPTRRFSSRAGNYVKYRPSYPQAVLATLSAECELTSASVIADIGSGTGLLTELFLENGNPVYAVEPNPEMRAEGERFLRKYSSFRSVAGRAEASTLADRSMDFVVAGQAFHWFEPQGARDEFVRILRPTGWGALIWNQVEIRSTAFLQAYERLLNKYATYRARVDHRERDAAAAAALFGVGGFKSNTFNHTQRLHHEGVRGRTLSLSSVPGPGDPDHENMLAELAEIFRTHQVHGIVEFPYVTTMYYGKVNA